MYIRELNLFFLINFILAFRLLAKMKRLARTARPADSSDSEEEKKKSKNRSVIQNHHKLIKIPLWSKIGKRMEWASPIVFKISSLLSNWNPIFLNVFERREEEKETCSNLTKMQSRYSSKANTTKSKTTYEKIGFTLYDFLLFHVRNSNTYKISL